MLKTVLIKIESASLLKQSTFDSTDLDDVLDNRDRLPFDSNWIKCYNEINAELVTNPLSKEDMSTIEIIRENAFKAVSSVTNQHEIASYISDDFDLIAKSIALASQNAFAKSLYDSYLNGIIPQ